MELIKHLILFPIIIICWTINPFLIKKPLKKLTPMHYFLLSSILSFSFISIYGLYMYAQNQFNFVEKLDKTDYLYLITISVLSIIASISFAYLVKTTNISYIRPHISSIIIILTTLFAGLFFNETININIG
jgi:uncharacterized membrane protein